MQELSIGEVARRAGIHASAMRYYESVKILTPPRRVNRRRLYDPSVFDQLAIIQLAQRAGFTVSEIRTLFNGFAADTPASERWQALAHQKLIEVEALVRRAQAMQRLLEEGLLRCRCLTLDECARSIREHRDSEALVLQSSAPGSIFLDSQDKPEKAV
jgi:MerR family redox-sensitive transcriptional activator SoxR